LSLSVNFKKEVRGFTLDVEWAMGNEIAVLFGHSGAGKSMTLQLLAGLMKPDEGFISSGGRVLFDSSQKIDVPPHCRSFGYVFQDLALFPNMTVRENILYGAKGLEKKERQCRFHTMMEIFRLETLENRMPYEISGGQKQRVAFARSLIRRPETLLLDEPFSALDNKVRLEMRNYLKDVQFAFQIPIVLVTHDVAEACALADKIIVYEKGRLSRTGYSSDVFHQPFDTETGLLFDRKQLCPAGFSCEFPRKQ
jgi:molybdate transport system ATP-binding protein